MDTLRSFFFIVVFIVGLAKTVTAQRPFEAEIRKFEQADSAVAPVENQIMLYGSSTFRFWKTAETDCAFGNLTVVNRGFGGSQTVDALGYALWTRKVQWFLSLK